MGYELHITRRTHWCDTDKPIRVQEWLELVAADPELQLDPEQGEAFAVWTSSVVAEQQWLDWHDGCVFSKNPDEVFIEKMCKVAAALKAKVQGDDGEVYQLVDGRLRSEVPEASEGSAFARFRDWLKRSFSAEPPRPKLDFACGDTVIDAWGNEHLILEIDLEAEHGLGRIRSRRSDGTELSFAALAHGLEKKK